MALSPEQIEALEKILGVKLPEGGFTMEIRPRAPGELQDGQLDSVAGGVGGVQAHPVRGLTTSIQVNVLGNNWSMKI